MLCSPQILGKDISSCTNMEINAEKERFKAMCFILRAEKSATVIFYKIYGRECTDAGTNIQVLCTTHTNCQFGHPKKLDTHKDKRENRVTAHKPAEEAKVSCLRNRADAADVEYSADADAEQDAETKIIKNN